MDGAGQQPIYAALVVQLQATVASLTKRIDDLEAENAKLAAGSAELRKKNPTQRLYKSYSMTAEEKRRQEAEQKAGPAKSMIRMVRNSHRSDAVGYRIRTRSIEPVCTSLFFRKASRSHNAHRISIARCGEFGMAKPHLLFTRSGVDRAANLVISKVFCHCLSSGLRFTRPLRFSF